MFGADHEIKDFYNKTFKNDIEMLVDDYIYSSVVKSYETTNQDIKATFQQLPDFIKAYYHAKAVEQITLDLLPVFQKKFTQPKEQEWVQFLEKHMPLYKQSAKKLSERKMPFDQTDTELMNVAFHYLSTTDIDRYVKLDRSPAVDKIESIKKKYNLQPHNVSISDLIELIKSGSTNHEDQLAKVYRLLFIFLTALMEKDYNGIIRQLTKLFVHQIEGAL